MRTLVERYCFIYGCVASVGAMVWYLTALAGYAELPQNVWVVESLALIHASTMVIVALYLTRPEPVSAEKVCETGVECVSMLFGGAAAVPASVYASYDVQGLHDSVL